MMDYCIQKAADNWLKLLRGRSFPIDEATDIKGTLMLSYTDVPTLSIGYDGTHIRVILY